MQSDNFEKSPIEPSDYQGLQLDTRAQDTTEKYVDPEKESIAEVEAGYYSSTQPTYSSAAHSSIFQSSTIQGSTLQSSGTQRSAAQASETQRSATQRSAIHNSETSSVHPSTTVSPKEKLICGVRRRLFWLILVAILIIIMLAAVVGGVVGLLSSNRSSPTPMSTPPLTSSGAAPPNHVSEPSPTKSPKSPQSPQGPQLPESQSNVILGSPLSMLAYAQQDPSVDNGTSGVAEQQSLRLFFQSAHGNIKWFGCDGALAPWRDATPIFTDALNNTGLSVFTYLNGTDRSFAIYYIGANGLVQEKRASLSRTTFLPTKLNSLNLKPAAALSIPSRDLDNDFKNSWDGFRMASVYSTNFHDGPGARLFYHSLAENGTSWVQEMIWNQNSDRWSQGAMIVGPRPRSRLAAIIDENGSTLRLFYSAGNRTLQESYLDIQDANSVYQTGASIPNFLTADDADLAAVAVNGDALIYHYSTDGTPSIRELNITGTPGSSSHPESYDLSTEPIVAQPALSPAGSLSLYQPIGAVLANATGAEPRIYVSWSEDNTAANSSYHALTVVSRAISDGKWPDSTYGQGNSQVDLPLGTNNVDPSS